MPKPVSFRTIVLVCLLLPGATACRRQQTEAPRYPTVEVRRGTLALTASADGVIEPIRKVEVKSKASGEVIAMNADTGDTVTQGQVLLQLLPRDAQNVYDQASADLEAAAARLTNAQAKLNRSTRLNQEGLLAASDLEADQLAVTTANSEVVRANKSRDTAAERLAETTVRSPINGTVIGKTVEIGQVVSSAVSQVSGGTLLLTLADLAEVQIRSLVDEVDIGKVKAGQEVTIRVEAYPDHGFQGEVLKVEPQAVVQQNVTMFPVLTRIDNREGLLMPGMNAEIEILIARRDDVLLVPNDALKRPEEARQIAAMMGLLGGESGGEQGPGERRAGGRPNGNSGSRNSASGNSAPGNGLPGNGPPSNGTAGNDAAPAGDDSQRMVFRTTPEGAYEMVPVEIGLRNWEDSEVISGLEQGARLVVLPGAAQLRQSQEFRQRMEQMRGIPGMSGGSRRGGGSG